MILRALRSIAGKCRRKIVRLLLDAALGLSTADNFIDEMNSRVRTPKIRRYLLRIGAAKLFDNVYLLANEDHELRDYLLRDAAERMFRSLYNPAMKNSDAREYMVAQGIDEIYRCVDSMALDLGTPVSQRVGGYGQEGEDLILTRIFEGQKTGFYVDVGAHHPFRFSNTFLLYQRGWNGINIDAMPGSMAQFRRWRPRDINVECLVSSEPGNHTYYQYDEPALNTVSKSVAQIRDEEASRYSLINRTTLEARRLDEILRVHVPRGTKIDLMNVDVEGLDLQVLKSNDWERYRPRVIVAEILGTTLADIETSDVYRFLTAKNYRLHSKLFNSAIFV